DPARAFCKAIGLIAKHDAGVEAGDQAREIELQSAERNRARVEEMPAREDQLLAQIDEGELPAVGEHRLEGVGSNRLQGLTSLVGAPFGCPSRAQVRTSRA